LIVLIIDARNFGLALLFTKPVIGQERNLPRRHGAAF
jgi:hypothetical protein